MNKKQSTIKDSPDKPEIAAWSLPAYFDHKDLPTLKRFINQFGQIEARRRLSSNPNKPALKAHQQKLLSRAIKRARFLALLPYVNNDSA